ncbi:hypothetical protein L228DRAFT_123650 [Xylona heveae TC161]|uniref:Zn(2)-C6 fungal-type domain-containing protein n=1 Tax=Xylona heveae (strain CBS 132557 / TC161) TaxID=1328760 RepID=A0A165HN85_XYLHT|nr:hypothetical protein L228DRAFT_123650 [Xylona heveae TC161]KZF23768.1 hypothetical protein L228DRAFT_123650 [Xylona heveae TC161]
MPPTPPSTTPSSGGSHSPDVHYRVVRKRNRVPLSCGPCRHRKLKCNRAHPCENCVKRGDAESCSYAAAGARKRNQSSHDYANSPDEMQNRIDRLEGLVLSLMTNGSQSAGPAAATAAISTHASTTSPEQSQGNDEEDMDHGENEEEESETDQVARSFGILKVENNKSTYFSDEHWASLLIDIAEVKNFFSNHKRQIAEQSDRLHQSKVSSDMNPYPFVFGATRPPNRAEILAAIPKKPMVDKLVERYFTSYDPALHIIHAPLFRKQLEQYWSDLRQANDIWIGLLYAIMRLAMQSYTRIGDEPQEFRFRSVELANLYRTLTCQCLVLSDFTMPVNYTLETMILYIQGEFTRSREAEVGVWAMVGMIVRLAMRQGYHRDPSHYPNVTPFQVEMRRRVWTYIRMMDILFSFQMSLPNMIRKEDSDTQLPQNYYDDDFDEDTKVLPPPRPGSESTPVAYMISKARLSFAFGKIVGHLHTRSLCSYDEVMRLDNELRAAYAMIPPHLQLRPMTEMGRDPPSVIMQRFSLDFLYNKGQCVLHRKFLARARENPRYAHSRRTCVDSAMELLHHQTVLHTESRPQGRLRGVEWFASSLTAHDFIMAAMIVCLDLYHGTEVKSPNGTSADFYTWGLERRPDMIQALETSKAIWDGLKERSVEAYKASGLLSVMIDKLRQDRAGVPPTPPSQPSPAMRGSTYPGGGSFPVTDGTFAYSREDPKPEHSAAMTLGMLSAGGMTPNSGAIFDRAYYPPTLGDVNITDATPTTNPVGNANSSLTDLAPQMSLDPPVTSSSSSAPTSGLDTSTGVAASAPSPFSLFGSGIAPTAAMDFSAPNLDWDAWDSYIQNNSLDPNMNPFWSGNNFDMTLSVSSADMGFDPLRSPSTTHQPSLSQPEPQTHHPAASQAGGSNLSFTSAPAGTGTGFSGMNPSSGAS